MGKTIYYGNTGLSKFGRSGNEGKTLAFYMNDNGTWEGIPFGHVRNSPAYQENDGVLTEVGLNVPRFQDGKYFTEGSATNRVVYTQDFTNAYWTKEDCTPTPNSIISPDGEMNGTLITKDISAGSEAYLIKQWIQLNASTNVTPIYIKKGSVSVVRIGTRATSISSSLIATFDLENGVVLEEKNLVAKIEDFGNGWYRCGVVVATNGGYVDQASLNISFEPTADINSTFYLWGANHCVGDDFSSYILGDGSIETRQADTGIQSLVDLSEQINSEEFELEFACALNKEGVTQRISVYDSNDSNNNQLTFLFSGDVDTIKLYAIGSGVVAENNTTITSTLDRAVENKYKVTLSKKILKVYINDILEFTSINLVDFVGFNKISLEGINGSTPLFATVDYLTLKP